MAAWSYGRTKWKHDCVLLYSGFLVCFCSPGLWADSWPILGLCERETVCPHVLVAVWLHRHHCAPGGQTTGDVAAGRARASIVTFTSCSKDNLSSLNLDTLTTSLGCIVASWEEKYQNVVLSFGSGGYCMLNKGSHLYLEAFATGVKIESSDQNLFWKAIRGSR